MNPIFLAQVRKESRNPLMLILFIVASVGLTIIFSGGFQAPTQIQVFHETDDMEVVEGWVERLAGEDTNEFVPAKAADVLDDIREGRRDLALQVFETDYQIVTTSSLPEINLLEQYVHQVFSHEMRIQSAIAQSESPEAIREEIESYLVDPPINLDVSTVGGDELTTYNMSTQLAFAFTLLVTMFIIGFRIIQVIYDKVSGVRNRILLSPMSKTRMYIGYISYSMFIGILLMVIIFTIFKYMMGMEVGNFLMLVVIAIIFSFSMTSIAMLITGFTRTPEQFWAIFPSIIPIIPLISGAYMTPGTMTNPVLNFIADLFPVVHAMDGFLDIAFYNASWLDLLQPIAVMILIGVIAMGVGINLVERRSS